MKEEKSSDFFVKYKNETYNLKEFLKKHPGGVNTLAPLRNCDLTNILSQPPLHSEAAMYLMKEYRVPRKDQNNNNLVNLEQKLNLSKNKSEVSSENKSAIQNGYSIGNGQNHTQDVAVVADKDSSNRDKAPSAAAQSLGRDDVVDGDADGRLEHLVDWNKAMLWQIGALGDKYEQWVNMPVDRPLKIFGPPWVEALTKTPWWAVPLFWIPVITYIVTKEFTFYNRDLHTVLVNFFSGIGLWTVTEYLLHRFVFHMDTKGAGLLAKSFHFLLHGLHHKVPSDPYRLVFPPVPAVILATPIYQILIVLFVYPRLIFAGGICGYLIYDMIHYYLHYGSPSNKYLYHIKRYHYQHHFVQHDKGFGISSPFWDYIFDTLITLRKLKMTLKW